MERLVGFVFMECDALFENLDWDPVYLSVIFDQDFDDFTEMWNSECVGDEELVISVENLELKEKYSPIVEDITMDDSTLRGAVEQIESE